MAFFLPIWTATVGLNLATQGVIGIKCGETKEISGGAFILGRSIKTVIYEATFAGGAGLMPAFHAKRRLTPVPMGESSPSSRRSSSEHCNDTLVERELNRASEAEKMADAIEIIMTEVITAWRPAMGSCKRKALKLQ